MKAPPVQPRRVARAPLFDEPPRSLPFAAHIAASGLSAAGTALHLAWIRHEPRRPGGTASSVAARVACQDPTSSTPASRPLLAVETCVGLATPAAGNISASSPPTTGAALKGVVVQTRHHAGSRTASFRTAPGDRARDRDPEDGLPRVRDHPSLSEHPPGTGYKIQ